MKNIGVLFTHLPHGTAKGREALDAALALSTYNKLNLFFIGDGVYHLLPNQAPDRILARNYIATFGILELYDIENCFVCEDDLTHKANLLSNTPLKVQPLSRQSFNQKLHQQDMLLTF